MDSCWLWTCPPKTSINKIEKGRHSIVIRPFLFSMFEASPRFTLPMIIPWLVEIIMHFFPLSVWHLAWCAHGHAISACRTPGWPCVYSVSLRRCAPSSPCLSGTCLLLFAASPLLMQAPSILVSWSGPNLDLEPSLSEWTVTVVYHPVPTGLIYLLRNRFFHSWVILASCSSRFACYINHWLSAVIRLWWKIMHPLACLGKLLVQGWVFACKQVFLLG